MKEFQNDFVESLKNSNIQNEYVSSGVFICMINENFTILETNSSFFKLIDITKESLKDDYLNEFSRLLHPDDQFVFSLTLEAQVDNKTDTFFTIRCKLLHGDGGYKPTQLDAKICYDDPDNLILCVTMTDITEIEETLETLEGEYSYNKYVTSLIDESFFDCNLKTKTIKFSQNFVERFMIDEILPDYPESLIKLGIVDDDSIDIMENRFKFTEDHPEGELIEEKIHYKTFMGKDVWFMDKYNIFYDSEGVPIRAIGKMTDITNQHNQIEELSKKAEKDLLTGLYNKITTEALIKDFMKTNTDDEMQCALLIVDVDNFKSINDKFGHLYGDAVLGQLGEYLKPIFRSNDVLGRIGGDEFFVFIKDFKVLDIVEKKANDICTLFKKTYVKEGISVQISSSIGIALYPEHGSTFEELYEKADTALYNSKSFGKNRFSLYEENVKAAYQSARTARTEIDDGGVAQKNLKENLLEYAFKLLYDPEDSADNSIEAVLQLVSENFNFDCSVVYQKITAKQEYDSTYIWKSETSSIANDSVPLLARDIPTIISAFFNTDVFILDNISSLSDNEKGIISAMNIKSLICFSLKKKGQLIGFIFFEDFKSERDFKQEKIIKDLSLVCYMLNTFINNSNK